MSLSEALSRVAAIEARLAAFQSTTGRLLVAQPRPTPGATLATSSAIDFEGVLASATASGTALPTQPVLPPEQAPGSSPAPGTDQAGDTQETGVDGAEDDLRPGVYAYPLGVRGEVIGLPYQGTHTLYGNWESENAVDIKVPTGTPVYAVADGVVGSQIGALDSSDPRLQGERLHLVTADNEFYYAHLSQIVVKPGEQVRKGQLIGYSGAANGVEHLHLAAKNGTPLSALLEA